MQKMILVDPEKCTGCRTCELVCSVKNEGVANPALSRVRIIRFDAVVLDVPMLCQQCASAPCILVCPTRAISRDDDLGVVKINYDRCIGCKMCLAVCPFGGMSFNPWANRVIKCDLCGGDPLCVKFCETKALQYVEVSAVNLLKKREAAQKLSELVRKFEELAPV